MPNQNNKKDFFDSRTNSQDLKNSQSNQIHSSAKNNQFQDSLTKDHCKRKQSSIIDSCSHEQSSTAIRSSNNKKTNSLSEDYSSSYKKTGKDSTNQYHYSKNLQDIRYDSNNELKQNIFNNINVDNESQEKLENGNMSRSKYDNSDMSEDYGIMQFSGKDLMTQIARDYLYTSE